MKIGLIINPIAGIGGAAGLKGSDETWETALDEGFSPVAAERARRFVAAVESEIDWLTGPGDMGLAELPQLPGIAELGKTNASDTHRVAKEMAGQVDLICFVGGDGTATDIAAAIPDTPCLGIPGGVKITSPVFAHDPDEAAWLIDHLSPGFETVARDVTDLDEEAYRAGRVETKLTGSLRVPLSPVIQGGKCATTQEIPLEPLVEQVMLDWDTEAAYLIGAGSVCRAVKQQFWGEPTLLGVDAIVANKIVATDLDGPAIESFVSQQREQGRRVCVMLSTIGGQGMLLGRGTQVLTPAALRRVGWDNIKVVAPPDKLIGLRGLHIDSGDPEFDALGPKYIKVTSGWHETRLLRLLHGRQSPDS